MNHGVRSAFRIRTRQLGMPVTHWEYAVLWSVLPHSSGVRAPG